MWKYVLEYRLLVNMILPLGNVNQHQLIIQLNVLQWREALCFITFILVPPFPRQLLIYKLIKFVLTLIQLNHVLLKNTVIGILLLILVMFLWLVSMMTHLKRAQRHMTVQIVMGILLLALDQLISKTVFQWNKPTIFAKIPIQRLFV